MKITGVECIPIGWAVEGELRWGKMAIQQKGSVLIRVNTDAGIVGLGEAGLSVSLYRQVAAIIETILSPIVSGRNPLDIEALWAEMFGLTHLWGRRGVETYALSGIEIALWDIAGKSAGLPIHRLLGTYRECVPVYAAPSLRPPDQVAEDCERAVSKGFRAIKLRTGLDGPTDAEIVRIARKTVGPDVALMVDGNSAYDLTQAIEVSRVLEDCGVSFFEEPLQTRSLPEYARAHRELAERVKVRLAGGECLFTRYEFAEVIDKRAFAVLQPDCTTSGGIAEVKKIGAMADAFGLQCIPHIACSSGTGIAFAAALQVVASLANCPWIEYDAYEDPVGGLLLEQGFPVIDGKVHVPDRPGLGIAIDEARLDRCRLDYQATV